MNQHDGLALFELNGHFVWIPLYEGEIRQQTVISGAADWKREHISFVIFELDPSRETQGLLVHKGGLHFDLRLCDSYVRPVWKADGYWQLTHLTHDLRSQF